MNENRFNILVNVNGIVYGFQIKHDCNNGSFRIMVCVNSKFFTISNQITMDVPLVIKRTFNRKTIHEYQCMIICHHNVWLHHNVKIWRLYSKKLS